MDISENLEDKAFKNKVILRKVVGWILFGFGILSIVISAFFLLGALISLLFLGAAALVFFPGLGLVTLVLFFFVLIFGAIAITLSILELLAGLYMAQGRKRRFVRVILIIFLVICVLDLLFAIISLFVYGPIESGGDLVGAVISLGIFGFFLFVLRDTWHTFNLDNGTTLPAKGGIIWPKEEFVPRDIREKPSIYTKEYTKELESERRRVKSTHKEAVPASGYDFGMISNASQDSGSE